MFGFSIELIIYIVVWGIRTVISLLAINVKFLEDCQKFRDALRGTIQAFPTRYGLIIGHIPHLSHYLMEVPDRRIELLSPFCELLLNAMRILPPFDFIRHYGLDIHCVVLGE